jgi:hypothetical protein
MVLSVIIISKTTVSSATLARPTSLSTKVPCFLCTRSSKAQFPSPTSNPTSILLRCLNLLLHLEAHLGPVEQKVLLDFGSQLK